MVRTAKVKIFKKLFTKHRGRGGGAEGLLGEVPAGGDLGGDLERVLVRGHSHLREDAASADELLARKGIDIHHQFMASW